MTTHNKYQEDISIAGAGTVLLGGPTTIRDITVVLEDAGAVVVNFSDTSAAYDSAYRCLKVALTGPNTYHLPFPEGMILSRGLCVTASAGSVDVRVTYD